MELQQDLSELFKVVYNYPAIDNHAHAFLKVENRDAMPFEGLISEASGPALTEDAVHTLACYKATVQLAKLFGLPAGATWEDVKRARSAANYDMLCRMCMGPTRIQCILIDDGLGVRDMVYDYKWHDRYTASPTKRVVRVEILAEVRMDVWIRSGLHGNRQRIVNNPRARVIGWLSLHGRLQHSCRWRRLCGHFKDCSRHWLSPSLMSMFYMALTMVSDIHRRTSSGT